MGFTVNIDTGGISTNGFFTRNGQIETVKVNTTPQDLAICLVDCIEEGARRFGVSTSEMLRNTEVVRLSATVGENTLVARSGPKLGVVATKGFKESHYAHMGSHPVFDSLLSADMVMGIEEESDALGNPVKAPREDEVREVVRHLLRQGARVIVVSLARASLSPAHEKRVKEMVVSDYPRHYLGAVPVILSSEVSPASDDELRTNTAIVNAYLQEDMARFSYKAEEELNKMGYRKPLLIVHSNGGVARVTKTSPINTCRSGAAGSLLGSAFLSRLYGLDKVASLDMGGTSTDVGIVIKGNCAFNSEPAVFGIPVRSPSVDVASISGASSVVRPDLDKGTVQVGPEIAGAIPGPACYGRGGTDATVTDACVVLGYIAHDSLLGGRMKVDGAKALEAIEERVARPLGLRGEEAALKVVKEAQSIAAEVLKHILSRKGLDARDFALFACGGAGGIFCSGIAQELGIPRIYCFPFSAVFSAFGCSTLDVLHTYESFRRVVLRSTTGDYLSQLEDFNGVLTDLRGVALRDMRGEGFGRVQVNFSLELELKGPAGPITLEPPKLVLEDQEDVERICDAYVKRLRPSKGEIAVETFRLSASALLPHYQFTSHPHAGKNPQKAYKGRRKLFWDGGSKETGVYEQKLLECGNEVDGPAVIESEDTTVLVPAGKRYTVDRFLNGVLELA